MKNIIYFGLLTILFAYNVVTLIEQGDKYNQIIITIAMISTIFVMVGVLMNGIEKEESKEVVKNQKIYDRSIIYQNALVIALLNTLYVVGGMERHIYSGESVLISVISLLISGASYVTIYREVNKNDRLKDILNYKEDTIIKKMYDFYYLTIGLLIIAIVIFICINFTIGITMMIPIVVLVLITNILQTMFLGMVLKS